MFEIDNVTYRNIQEQVQKNKSDIAAIRNVELTLNNFGITVLGQVDTEADIPEAEYNYGDAYLVGTEEPYDMYIFTRADADGEFVNIGPLNIVGPAGPQGSVGPAPELSIGTVATGSAGSSASATITGSDGVYTINFTIPKGDAGAVGATGSQGPIGLTGPSGPAGSSGPQGDPGESFMIMGTITNTSQLPDPTETPRNYAYVYSDGDASTPDRLYYITGNAGEEVWSYCNFAAVGTTVSVNGTGVSTFNADTKQDVLTTSSVTSGTPTSVIGFDSLGNLVRGAGSSGTNTLYYVEIPSSQTQILDAATIAAITATPQPCLKDATTGAIYVPTAKTSGGTNITIYNWYALRNYNMTEQLMFNSSTQRMSRTTMEVQVKFRASETPTEDSSFKVQYVIGFTGDQLTSAVRKMPIAEVARTGDYGDLLNRPSIPAAQVQSDWNQSDNTAVDYIKNKPAIPTTASSSSSSTSTVTPTTSAFMTSTTKTTETLIFTYDDNTTANITIVTGVTDNTSNAMTGATVATTTTTTTTLS